MENEDVVTPYTHYYDYNWEVDTWKVWDQKDLLVDYQSYRYGHKHVEQRY